MLDTDKVQSTKLVAVKRVHVLLTLAMSRVYQLLFVTYEAILQKANVAPLVKRSPAFYRIEGLSSCSQELVNDRYPEPAQSSLHIPISFP
jgi:hypothetical protein